MIPISTRPFVWRANRIRAELPGFGLALARTIRELGEDLEHLPTERDESYILAPVGKGFRRRIAATGYWIVFVVREDPRRVYLKGIV